MPSNPMSRRAFLATTGGAVLLAACGSSGDKSGGAAKAGAGSGQVSAFRMEIEPYVSQEPQRFAFILVDNERNFAGGPDAELQIAPPGAKLGDRMPATYHDEGLPKGHGVYTVDAVLPEPGNWNGRVFVSGKGEAELAFPVVPTPETPPIGGQGPVVTSPTVAAPLDTNPLCTRTDAQSNPAPCAFHDHSLDTVIGKGTPVIAMFATPARCQSRYCGPVLDQLIGLAPEYADRIVAVHTEIFKDLQTNNLVTATEAWLGTTGEPWVFALDGAGNVKARLSGAFATDEVRGAIEQALA